MNHKYTLKKEYAMVTSLDNYPRIIKFFGFVTDEKEVQLIILMEYLEKGSLADKLKANLCLTIQCIDNLSRFWKESSFFTREIYIIVI